MAAAAPSADGGGVIGRPSLMLHRLVLEGKDDQLEDLLKEQKANLQKKAKLSGDAAAIEDDGAWVNTKDNHGG